MGWFAPLSYSNRLVVLVVCGSTCWFAIRPMCACRTQEIGHDKSGVLTRTYMQCHARRLCRPKVVQQLAYLNIKIKNMSADADDDQSESPSTPCELGIYARWVLAGNNITHSLDSSAKSKGSSASSDYVFEAYPCVGKLEPIREFAPTMLRKGIQEITFLGDSHLRNLAMSLEYFAMGNGGLFIIA